MSEFKALAPTFARYALLTIGARMTAGGWMSPDLAAKVANDPAVIELVAGILVQAAAVAWFAASKARKAIEGAVK